MQNNLNLIKRFATLVMLVLSMSVLFVSLDVTTQAQTSSVPKPESSESNVSDDAFRRMCAEALEELRAARRLITAQGKESKLLVEMIELEREISTGLKNLRNLDAAEVVQLKKAIDAKDRVIAALEAEVVVLKKNRWGFWKKAKAIAAGVGAGIVIGAIVTNR